MSEVSKPRDRVLSFDVIRIVAVLAVVMIHSAATFIAYPPQSVEFIMANIFDGISRIGVPLFVMISGALMLDENKNLPIKTMLKYALKIFILLCIWSLLYAVVYQIITPLSENKQVSVSAFFNAFVYGHYHLWYLYMLIGLYLITPILRAFVKKSNEKIVFYFIVLAAIFQFAIPLVNVLINEATQTSNLLLNFSNKFKMGYVGQYTAYYLLGWYLTNVSIKKTYRSLLYILGFAGVLITILGTQLMINDTNKIYNTFYSDIGINVMFYSIGVFVFLFHFYKDKKYKHFNKISAALSKLTFGVYLIHPYIIFILNKHFNTRIAPLQLLMDWAIAVAVSFLITFILSKIPLLKKLVRY